MSKVSPAKEIWVDPHTFGKSRACEVLADMMNKDLVSTQDKHKILRFINNVTHRVNDIAQIPASSTRIFIMQMVKLHYYDQASGKLYPTIIKTHLHNVINYLCVNALEGVDRVIKKI